MAGRNNFLPKVVCVALTVLGAGLFVRGASYPGADEKEFESKANLLRAERQRLDRESRIILNALKEPGQDSKEFNAWVKADEAAFKKIHEFDLKDNAFYGVRAAFNTAKLQSIYCLVIGGLQFLIGLFFWVAAVIRQERRNGTPTVSTTTRMPSYFGPFVVLVGSSLVAFVFLYFGHLDYDLESITIRHSWLEKDLFQELSNYYQSGGISGSEMIAVIDGTFQESDDVLQTRDGKLQELFAIFPAEGQLLYEHYQARDKVKKEIAEAYRYRYRVRRWRPHLLSLGIAIILFGFYCTFVGDKMRNTTRRCPERDGVG